LRRERFSFRKASGIAARAHRTGTLRNSGRSRPYIQNPDRGLRVPQISCKSLSRDYTARDASTHGTTEPIAAHSYCASPRLRFDSASPIVLSLPGIPLQAANITSVQPLRFAGRLRPAFLYDTWAPGGKILHAVPDRPANRYNRHHPPIADVSRDRGSWPRN
jgi:hypothetical protein